GAGRRAFPGWRLEAFLGSVVFGWPREQTKPQEIGSDFLRFLFFWGFFVRNCFKTAGLSLDENGWNGKIKCVRQILEPVGNAAGVHSASGCRA
ncbi:MAG: hypothetical protein J6A23_04625, partial [Thermoguttaceae bacterium]|nr:hypothetical protein [Thermoguttaceae bacterium]